MMLSAGAYWRQGLAWPATICSLINPATFFFRGHDVSFLAARGSASAEHSGQVSSTGVAAEDGDRAWLLLLGTRRAGTGAARP